MTESGAIHCDRPDATRRAGGALGRVLRAGDLVGLVGNLGAGKTLFVQSVALGLGVPEGVRVTSPTFTLVNEYRSGPIPLFHADLYRIERENELDEIGLDELCRAGEGVVVIEWSNRFAVLPSDHLEIRLDIAGETVRVIRPIAHGPRATELLASWRGELDDR